MALFLSCLGCGGPVTVDAGEDAPLACRSDEECANGLFCDGRERCAPDAAGADAFGCAPDAPPCMASQSCDEAGDACITDCGAARDADGDGVDAISCGGSDCDDANAARFPGQIEICDPDDGDEDCDLSTFGVRDADGDGYPDASCCNGERCGDDCDDSRSIVHPSEAESCDLLDNDCDGLVDDGVGRTFFPDADGDGYGDASAEPMSVCTPPADHVENDGDCDDALAAVHPGALEICNGTDDDCDDATDESGPPRVFYADADGDGFGDGAAILVASVCAPPSGHVDNPADCDDGDGATYPGALELCDRIDSDCSAGGRTEVLEDFDADGHAPPDAACEGGPIARDDCVDTDRATHPGATELCDRIDSDCSSGGGVATDEDADGDRHAPVAAACTGGFARDDCDDAVATTYAGALEICNRVDDDCSLMGGAEIGEDADNDGYAPLDAFCTGGPLPRADCDDGAASITPLSERAPILRAPANGATTGSLHARARGTLRPTFVWERGGGGCAPRFELQLDDSCAAGSYASCAFASPELTAGDRFTLSSTSFRPASDLAVSSSRPVGRRYAWRVRPCSGPICGPWSAVRYVDVGRVPWDFEGDGYSDALRPEPNASDGSFARGVVYVHPGSASGPPFIFTNTLRAPVAGTDFRFGSALAACDTNGDGYGDVFVGAPRQGTASVPFEGHVHLFLGGPGGLSSVTASPNDSDTSGSRFGSALACADIDGNGFADVAIGAPSANGATFFNIGLVYVHAGTASGIAPAASILVPPATASSMYGFGQYVAMGSDLDGDGFGDLAIGANPDYFNASVQIHRGSAGGIGGPAATINGVTSVAAGGDVDGDYYGDLLLGNASFDAGASQTGQSYLVLGRAVLPSTPDVTHVVGSAQSGERTGSSLALGDLDGDGLADAAVGAPLFDSGPRTDAGRAFVYLGAASPGTSANVIAVSGSGTQFSVFMYSGLDVNGDGLADLLVQDGGYRMHVFFGRAGGVATSPTISL